MRDLISRTELLKTLLLNCAMGVNAGVLDKIYSALPAAVETEGPQLINAACDKLCHMQINYAECAGCPLKRLEGLIREGADDER